MTGSITLRPLFSRIVAVVTVAIALAAVVALVATGDPDDYALGIAGPALAGYVAWLVLWQPAVHVDDGGVRLENVFRTVRLPWPAIERIDTQWALTLFTGYGRFVAWAAPAPGRHAQTRMDPADARALPESAYLGGSLRPGDIPRTPSGDAATIIRLRWQELRDAGHLDDARLESERPPVRVHWIRIAVLVALVGALVAGAVL
jgi:hypothetical protein